MSAESIEIARGHTIGGTATTIRLHPTLRSQIGKGAFATVTKMPVKIDERKTVEMALKTPAQAGVQFLKEEIELLSQLRHPNVLGFKFTFERDGVCNAGMELFECGDLYEFNLKNHTKTDGIGIYCEVFGYQMFRGLAYLHSKKVVHRDMKPENLLVCEETGVLKIIDFGCGKRLRESTGAIGTPRRDTFRVGTKEFRAPELLLRSTKSTTKIDIWSAGVIMSEMSLGKPIFGEGPKDDYDQFFRIAAFLGEPSINDRKEMHLKRRLSDRIKTKMNKMQCCAKEDTSGQDFADMSLHGAFQKAPVHDVKLLLDLLDHILVYSPTKRLNGFGACAHDFFKRLRNKDAKLPNGNGMPNLFDFTSEELRAMSDEAKSVLVKLMT